MQCFNVTFCDVVVDKHCQPASFFLTAPSELLGNETGKHPGSREEGLDVLDMTCVH